MSLASIWNFLWNEDSLASWTANIILAFILIRFVVYPVLGLVLGTSFPIVAVVSGSMEHSIAPLNQTSETYHICGKILNETRRINFDGYWEYCGPWYENKDITKEDFSKFKLSNGFNKGDIIIIQSAKNIYLGDVIVYWGNFEYPIIHRVIEIKDGRFNAKGDHNSRDDGFIGKERVLGKALFRIPYFGWIKIGFVELINIPINFFGS